MFYHTHDLSKYTTLEAIQAQDEQTVTDGDRSRSEWFSSKYDWWHGGIHSFEDIAKLVRDGDAETRNKLEAARREASALAVPVAQSIRPAWTDRQLVGTRVDLAAALAGQPRAWGRFERNRMAAGSKIVTIYIPIGEVAHVQANELVWQPVAGIVLADMLEAAGYRCEIYAFSTARSNADYESEICERSLVKDAHTPMDVGSLARIAHPGFYRMHMLSLSCTTMRKYNKVGLGRGSGTRACTEPDMNAGFGDVNAIVMPRGLSLSATVENIKGAVEKFTEGSTT